MTVVLLRCRGYQPDGTDGFAVVRVDEHGATAIGWTADLRPEFGESYARGFAHGYADGWLEHPACEDVLEAELALEAFVDLVTTTDDAHALELLTAAGVPGEGERR